jgi:hypothetical protein
MNTLTLHNATLVSYFTMLNFVAATCAYLLTPAPFTGQLLCRKSYSRIEDDGSDVPRGLRLAMAAFYKPISVPLYMQFTAVYIFSFYVWSTAATFGNQHACNEETRLVFFGTPLKATRRGRLVALGKIVFFPL